MKRSILPLLAFILFSCTAGAQKVYSVDYSSQADVKVFVVKYESQADLKVYKVKYESQAGEMMVNGFSPTTAARQKRRSSL